MENLLMPGGEPFFYKAGDVGCLLIHGFTGTPSSLQPMGKHLSQKGITTLGVRLKGHGTKVEDMHNCYYLDWISSAEQGLWELKKYCKKVYVSGLSMGGAIALYLTALYGNYISGVVPVCAPVFMRDCKMIFVPVLKHVVKTVPAIGGNLKDSQAVEITYDKTSVPAIHQLLILLSQVKRELPSIRQPSLIFASPEDAVVSPDNAPYIYNNISSRDKELVWLDNSYHVATLDYDKELIFNKTAEFILSDQE